MIPRGEVGLITASLGWAAGLVTREVYVQVVVIVLLTTLITPPLLRFTFPRAIPVEPDASGGLADLSALPPGVSQLADA